MNYNSVISPKKLSLEFFSEIMIELIDVSIRNYDFPRHMIKKVTKIRFHSEELILFCTKYCNTTDFVFESGSEDCIVANFHLSC